MSTAWSSPVDLHAQIIERVGGGESLADIERELIQPAALSEDDKAGLWLFGWSWASSCDRRPKCAQDRGLPWLDPRARV